MQTSGSDERAGLFNQSHHSPSPDHTVSACSRYIRVGRGSDTLCAPRPPALCSFPPSPVSIARFSSTLHSSTISTTTTYSANSCQIQVCRRWARVNRLTLCALPASSAHPFDDSILSSLILAVAFRKLLLAARVPGVETTTLIHCNTSRQVSTGHTITLASTCTTSRDCSFTRSHQQSTFTAQCSTIQRAAITHHLERAKA